MTETLLTSGATLVSAKEQWYVNSNRSINQAYSYIKMTFFNATFKVFPSVITTFIMTLKNKSFRAQYLKFIVIFFWREKPPNKLIKSLQLELRYVSILSTAIQARKNNQIISVIYQ